MSSPFDRKWRRFYHNHVKVYVWLEFVAFNNEFQLKSPSITTIGNSLKVLYWTSYGSIQREMWVILLVLLKIPIIHYMSNTHHFIDACLEYRKDPNVREQLLCLHSRRTLQIEEQMLYLKGKVLHHRKFPFIEQLKHLCLSCIKRKKMQKLNDIDKTYCIKCAKVLLSELGCKYLYLCILYFFK